MKREKNERHLSVVPRLRSRCLVRELKSLSHPGEAEEGREPEMSASMDLGLPLHLNCILCAQFAVSGNTGMQAGLQSNCAPGPATSSKLGLN